MSSQHPAEDPRDLSWANGQSIKSFFSVSKKVKIDKTQQTDPGGEHEDEGRQDIQEPDQVGAVETQAKTCPREWDLFV